MKDRGSETDLRDLGMCEEGWQVGPGVFWYLSHALRYMSHALNGIRWDTKGSKVCRST